MQASINHVTEWAKLNGYATKYEDIDTGGMLTVSADTAKGIVDFYAWCCHNEYNTSSIQNNNTCYYIIVWFTKK